MSWCIRFGSNKCACEWIQETEGFAILAKAQHSNTLHTLTDRARNGGHVSRSSLHGTLEGGGNPARSFRKEKTLESVNVGITLLAPQSARGIAGLSLTCHEVAANLNWTI
eukprot:2637435-Amphidinium_carterae.1